MAQPAAPAFIPVGDAADAPVGFIEMCGRDRALCLAGLPDTEQTVAPALASFASPQLQSATAGHVAPVTVEAGARRSKPAGLKLLKKVNSAVNHTVRQVSDDITAGVDERWQRPERAGDCEDIAIEKRARLLAMGFPADHMFFAVTYRSGYGLHTVLLVRLADGDYVLDSLAPRIVRWSQTQYSWLRVQSTSDPFVWRRFGPPPAETLHTDLAASAGSDTAI